MNNIIIFKTSVQDETELGAIRPLFNNLFGEKNWSFAFEDVDKILRVVCIERATALVIKLLANHGFNCEELPYSLD